MARTFFVSVFSVAALASGCAMEQEHTADEHETAGAAITAMKITYPDSPRGDTTDNYHGVDVTDPYRWLEDLADPATEAWIVAQNELANPYLEKLKFQEAFKKRMTELWNYERVNKPFKHGKHYFYSRNDGLQDQDIVYTTTDLNDEPRVLIDPNTLRDDATVALNQVEPSHDGSLVAYSLSDGGSDWRNWFVRDTESGKDLDDVLTYTKFSSVSWLPDNSGFYYSRHPKKSLGTGDGSKPVTVYFHKIGEPQDSDKAVYSIKDNDAHNPYAYVTDDGNYLVISVSEGYLANAIHYKALKGDTKTVRLMDDWDAVYQFLGNVGDTFYFRTSWQAPNWQVIAVDLKNPAPSNWVSVIPAKAEALEDASLVGGKLIANYLKDVKSVIEIYSTDGDMVQALDWPEIGTISGFNGSPVDTETFFSFTGFTTPSEIYRFDVASGKAELFRKPEYAADLSQYDTRQVFVTSKDGMKIPMYILHKKGMALDGKNPTMLYGYGGFDVSITPAFNNARLVWLEAGGVLAIANLRGGGEYGQSWHKAGTKLQKQNVFDDFIAAAEYLIEKDYASPATLGISGRSNGGLLVGAVMLQRPELFGATLPAVGVLDMLRYHTPSANARAWSSDYGLSEDPEEFKAMYAYSPVHNIKTGTCYPPTLITTADRDDRVVPWHSFKFAAALQHAQGCDNPVIIRIETRAGHGAGKPTWMIIEDYAYQWAFLAEHLGEKFSLKQ